MKKIRVLFQGWGQDWPLGTLADNGTRLLFEYSVEALERRIEFSPQHLKLRAQAYGEFPQHTFHLPGLIADSLPDGWGMLLMDRLFLKSNRDPARVSPLARLAVIHDHAMGAFVFEPADPLNLSTEDVVLHELAREAREAIEDKDIAALKKMVLLGGSPQGARPKVLIQYESATETVSSIPFAGGEPWMVKFQDRGEHKEVCAIEYAYAKLAERCGIEMPQTRYFDLDKNLAAFGIARFDRTKGQRVPLHTLAGLLHADFRVPGIDYSTFLRATRMLTRDEREVEKAFVRCAFNVVFNNRDDHAKNFSYRMDSRMQWTLAPGYDLTFNAGPRGEHQTAIMGEGLHPGKKELLELAQTCGVEPLCAKQALARVAEVAENSIRNWDEHPIRRATQKTLTDAIKGNLCRLV